jgi:hypothetical protein
MGRLDLEILQPLADRAGVGAVLDVVPLAGGANNRVSRLDASAGSFLLKSYFRHPDDPRDRLGAEFGFAQFAWERGVRGLPQPLACEPAAGLGLFEFVRGEKLAAATNSDVEQAIAFFRNVNRFRKNAEAAKLPRASESCLSLNDHFHTVSRRVERLAGVEELAEFANGDLLPVWERVQSAARSAAALNCLPTDHPLPFGERGLSPSDFGFHNAIRAADGWLRFFDFEYAGWDDPAKTICDFFCQPAIPAPAEMFERFAWAVAAEFPSAAIHLARAALLLPVYRVKWVCIMLNEFLPVGGRRRAFSGTVEELAERKSLQLAKAKAALALIQLHSPARKVA